MRRLSLAFGTSAAWVARGVELRHDHGCQDLTKWIQGQSRYHGCTYRNRAELATAPSAIGELYNREWRLEKPLHRSPIQARRDY